MDKLRLTIYLDPDIEALLRARALTMRVPVAVAARVLLSTLLAPGPTQKGGAPEPMGNLSGAVPQHLATPSFAGAAPEPMGRGSQPMGNPSGTHGEPLPMGSWPTQALTLPEEEKKKKEKRRGEGKAKRAEADGIFDEAMALWQSAGLRTDGKTGNATTARYRWHDNRRDHGVEAAELLTRTRRFIGAIPPGQDPKYLPSFGEFLLWRNGFLDLGSLAAREKARGALVRAQQRPGEGIDHDAVKETRARRDQIPPDPGVVELVRRNEAAARAAKEEAERAARAAEKDEAERQALMFSDGHHEALDHSSEEIEP